MAINGNALRHPTKGVSELRFREAYLSRRLATTERGDAGEAKAEQRDRAGLGNACGRLGRNEDAHECFRKVVERNPKHLEASREVRLFEMRARNSLPPKSDSGTSKPEAGGLLSKLFGGEKKKT